MKKVSNLIILGSIGLIFIGMIIFVISLSTNDWDFGKFNSENISTNTYQVEDYFNNIVIEEANCDINIVYTENSSCNVVAEEKENVSHIVEVKDNTLIIKENDQRKWYEKLINFSDTLIIISINKNILNDLKIDTATSDINISNKFTFNNITINGSTSDVELYSNVIDDVEINLSTGDIEVNNITCKNMNLQVSTGDIEIENVNCLNDLEITVSTGDVDLDNVSCNNFNSNGSTGKIILKNVIALNSIDLQRSTGDIKFEKCDALNIVVITDTGSVKGTLLSSKIFDVETDTGKKDVPESVSGGSCKITTDTGDIIIEIIDK